MKSRKSPRRKEYDYTSAGGYFITICTKDRVHYFGSIIDGEMITNQLGNICIKEIMDTQEYRSHIIVDEYIIMPNHIIRNENEYAPKEVLLGDNRIKYYIQTNPQKRNDDNFIVYQQNNSEM